MSILVNKDTRVLVQGLGKAGTFHGTQCRDYGTQIVGGVAPGKGGTVKEGFHLFNSVAEGVHIFRTDKERAMRVMAKYTKVSDRKILENTYADNKEVHSPNMRPTATGVKTILDILAASNPKAAAAKPEQFIDVSLSRRLEESGLIKKF